PEVVFCFDGDRAGRDAAWRALDNALPILKEGHELRFLFLPDGEDPDTLVRKEGKAGFEARLDEATPLSQYFFDQLAQSIDLKSLDGRARLVELAHPYIARIPEGLFRHMMANQLASLAKVEVARIEAKINKSDQPVVTAPSRPKKRPAMRGQPERTPLRRVIALLLNFPNLAEKIDDVQSLSQLQLPGIPLLIQLLEMIQQQPHISSAVLLERWRNTEHWPHLEKLLAWDPMQNAGVDVELEFQASLTNLMSSRHEHRVDALLARADLGDLSAEEKQELKQLLSRTGP
ncbi:MAG: DNA primase, partial [Gammaproteobacteria bacterium]|nr:DNA primase [Gammaproteobacteria bacterium]